MQKLTNAKKLMLKKILLTLLVTLCLPPAVAKAEITSELLEKYKLMFSQLAVSTVIEAKSENCRAAGHPVLENLVVLNFFAYANLRRALEFRFTQPSWAQYLKKRLGIDPYFEEDLGLLDDQVCGLYTLLQSFRLFQGTSLKLER